MAVLNVENYIRTYDVIIIGGGIAGLTTAIYSVRSGLSVLVLEKKYCGGQIVDAAEVENYPGIKRISGADFATAMNEQVVEQGADVKYEEVINVEMEEEYKYVHTGKKKYRSKNIVIATGLTRRTLGIPEEKRYSKKGVSYCATCDGAFYREKDVVVVGGGNAAISSALYLSDICCHVYLVHRNDRFRADTQMLEKMKDRGNIVIFENSSVMELKGEDSLKEVIIKNNINDMKNIIKAEGLFVSIGQIPCSNIFSNLINVDKEGYILTDEMCRTNVNGIYAAGDCRKKAVRQLVTAACDGAVIASVIK